MIHISRTPSTNGSLNSRLVDGQNRNVDDEAEEQRASPASRRIGDFRITSKCESDDPTTASETMNSDLVRKRKIFAKRVYNSSKVSHSQSYNNNTNNNNSITENPVENIRKQLEKLEDLGDQLPSNETAYTLRYPFQDKGD